MVVGVATGAFLFVADLVRKIHLPITVDFVRAESYGSGTVSNGKPTVSFGLKVDVRGKHVLLVGFMCLKFELSALFYLDFLMENVLVMCSTI